MYVFLGRRIMENRRRIMENRRRIMRNGRSCYLFCPDKSRTHPHPSPTHHSSSCYSPATLLGSCSVLTLVYTETIPRLYRDITSRLELVADIVPKVADMFALVHVGVASSFVFALEPCLVRCLVTYALLGVAICSGRQCLTLAHSGNLVET